MKTTLSHASDIRWSTAVRQMRLSGLDSYDYSIHVRLETNISLRSANLSINLSGRDAIGAISPRIRVRNSILCVPHHQH